MSNIISLQDARKKREMADNLAKGRTPLYVSHLTGKVTGNPSGSKVDADDFGARLQRIKASLDKINRLMEELKKNAQDRSE